MQGIVRRRCALDHIVCCMHSVFIATLMRMLCPYAKCHFLQTVSGFVTLTLIHLHLYTHTLWKVLWKLDFW